MSQQRRVGEVDGASQTSVVLLLLNDLRILRRRVGAAVGVHGGGGVWRHGVAGPAPAQAGGDVAGDGEVS